MLKKIITAIYKSSESESPYYTWFVIGFMLFVSTIAAVAIIILLG